MYFFLKEPKSDKETLIYLIYPVKDDPSKNKKFKYSTGIKIHPDNWDFGSRLPKIKRGAEGKKNKHVKLVLDPFVDFLDGTVKNAQTQNTTLTRDFLKNAFNIGFKNKTEIAVKNETSIVEVMQLFIDAKNKSKGQSKSWNDKYINLKTRTILFDIYKGKKTNINELNDDWIGSYCGFLRELSTIAKKDEAFISRVRNSGIKTKFPHAPMNDNTLNRHINFLFTFLNWSVGKYHSLDMSKLKNPVREFQPEKVYLTTKEIELLETYHFVGKKDEMRDLFLVGIYSGQRFSDYSVFEIEDLIHTEHGEMIVKKSEKMEEESFIPMHRKLRAILDKYEWDLPQITSQKFNKRIQAMFREMGVTISVKRINYSGNNKVVTYSEKCDLIGSHTARRTFITISSEKGMPDHIIMKITGIKDAQTLNKYKKTSQESVINFGQKIWG